jgi:gamma-glutamyltranspeptidase/glutathione hydrolase
MTMKTTKQSLALVLAVFLFNALLLAGASKAPVRARHGMVVSSHYLASQVGVDVLRSGGNAVDAAVATGLALAVVHPSAGNVGGGGFMIVRMNDGRMSAFDFREQAPAAAHEKMFLDAKGNYSAELHHVGYLSIGVPGTVAGFDMALKKFGTKSWGELTAPAVRLAENGFSLTWEMADNFRFLATDFATHPASAHVFLKHDGNPFEADQIWKQPDLAKTLRRIQQLGKIGFYKGETARLFASCMKRHGGLITEADLAAYEAKERPLIHGTYRGYDIYSMAPPSSGGTILVEMLNVLEGFDLRSMGHNSTQYLHLLTETMRRAYADRARYLGDPDFNKEMPIDRLTSKKYAEKIQQSINLKSATPSEPKDIIEAQESMETTHYSVIDAQGNVAVVTYTLEYAYGSRIVADSLGFLLNNEMGDFNPRPGLTDTTGLIGTKPNLVAPGKRMLSSMTPTIVLKDGKPFMLTGSPGGRTIITTVLQTILNVVDFGMNITQAVTAGRVHHQWLPDVLRIEQYATSPDTELLLEKMGHRIKEAETWGAAMGIMIDLQTGLRLGGADPRAEDAAAIGY